VNHGEKGPVPLKKGQVIKGSVGYQKKEEGSRALDIEVRWEVDSNQKKQVWSLQ
jgi:protein arginine N-methyltransferase 3